MTQPLSAEERTELVSRLAAYWGPNGAPASLLTYGPPGSGKTADQGLTFHRNGIYVGILQHLASIPANTGIPMAELPHYDVGSISQIFPIMHGMARWNLDRIRAGQQPYLALCIDDLQYLADGQFRLREQENAAARAAEGKNPDTRAVFGMVSSDIEALFYTARSLGVHLWINAHARDPDNDLPRGTPFLPSRNMGSKVCGYAGTLLYAQKEDRSLGSGSTPALAIPGMTPAEPPPKPFGWPGHYFSHHDRYVCRDRLGTAPVKGPMNMRELLVAAGHIIPRPSEHTWMEEVVEAGAQALLSGQSYWDEVRPGGLKAAAAHGHAPRAAATRWLLRDIIDRYRIRESTAEPVFY
jgi:hypothetical protein